MRCQLQLSFQFKSSKRKEIICYNIIACFQTTIGGHDLFGIKSFVVLVQFNSYITLVEHVHQLEARHSTCVCVCVCWCRKMSSIIATTKEANLLCFCHNIFYSFKQCTFISLNILKRIDVVLILIIVGKTFADMIDNVVVFFASCKSLTKWQEVENNLYAKMSAMLIGQARR